MRTLRHFISVRLKFRQRTGREAFRLLFSAVQMQNTCSFISHSTERSCGAYDKEMKYTGRAIFLREKNGEGDREDK